MENLIKLNEGMKRRVTVVKCQPFTDEELWPPHYKGVGETRIADVLYKCNTRSSIEWRLQDSLVMKEYQENKTAKTVYLCLCFPFAVFQIYAEDPFISIFFFIVKCTFLSNCSF